MIIDLKQNSLRGNMVWEIYMESDEPKPTEGVPVLSTIYEYDTGYSWYFSKNREWKKMGWNRAGGTNNGN